MLHLGVKVVENHLVQFDMKALTGDQQEKILVPTLKYSATLKRGTIKIVLWVDDCGGQDKNWVLYSMFC